MLGFPVRVWSRTAKPVPAGITGFHGRDGLKAMLPDTEILVNLLPLTAETRFILNRDLFDAMRRGGTLIQVGRGQHLNEADLLARSTAASWPAPRSTCLPPNPWRRRIRSGPIPASC
jgi:glyoxylate/hydroxypyruvate reductase A